MGFSPPHLQKPVGSDENQLLSLISSINGGERGAVRTEPNPRR